MILIKCKTCSGLPSIIVAGNGHAAVCWCGKRVQGTGVGLSEICVADAWNRVNFTESAFLEVAGA